jgi:GT2 family glycosyltransferase
MISAVVLTGGRRELLSGCLASLRMQDHPGCEVVVVDNAPGAGIGALARQEIPSVRVVVMAAPASFSEGMNAGIAVAQGQIIACLNDDVELERDFFSRASAGFAVDARIGMVTGRVLRRDRVTIDSTGLSVSVWGTARERGYGREACGRYLRPGYVFGVTGAVGLFRREMLEEVREEGGYFDPRFPFFYEDLDLSWRAPRRGWKGYYVPDAVAYHFRGATVRRAGGEGKPRARQYLDDKRYAALIVGRRRCLEKNQHAFSRAVHAPFQMAYSAAEWLLARATRPQALRVARAALSKPGSSAIIE